MPPRNVTGPVVKGDDLWGRAAAVDELWSRLHRGNVLLSAPRRYGKTSLMRNLQDQPRPGWSVVSLNVEWVETQSAFANELVAHLLVGRPIAALLHRLQRAPSDLRSWLLSVVEELSVGMVDVGEIRARLRQNAPTDWRAAVESFLPLIDDGAPSTVIILDEFPVMVSTFLDRDERGAVAFLHWFRALRQQRRGFLVGGSVNIEPVLIRRGISALINDLERFRLPPFTKLEARQFVADVFAGEGIPVDPAVAGHLAIVVGSGVPFFLQVVIDEVRAAARQRQVLPSIALVDEVLHDVVLGPDCHARFSHYLERLKHYAIDETAARAILYEAAVRDRVPLADLRAIADQAGADPDRVLVRLQSDWYLEADAQNAWFADEFVRQWWRRSVPAGRPW